VVSQEGLGRRVDRTNDIRVIQEQNPWLDRGLIPEELAPKSERPIVDAMTARIWEDDPHRFHLILGPRRVGKTTVMYQVVRRLLAAGVSAGSLCWIRLDHPGLMEVPLGDLCRSIIESCRADRDQPLYLFLDELTYARGWDLWLKTFYDERWPVRILGTSSATAVLRERRLESGVGRWEEHYLGPYLLDECLGLTGSATEVEVEETLRKTLEGTVAVPPAERDAIDAGRRRLLLTGGFPELLRSTGGPGDESSIVLRSQRTLRSDAVERAIYKDVPQAFDVRSPMELERLLYTLAGQLGGIASPQKIGRGLELSPPTVDRYLSYLERAFLVFRLPSYAGSEGGRQKRGRKVYFTDSAVRNAALQRGLAFLASASEMGLLLENMAAAHLWVLGEQTGARIYYWRDGEDEVDLVYDHPTEPLAFEVALRGEHSREGLRALTRQFPRFLGRCYLVADDVLLPRPASPERIGELPLNSFLLAVGRQAEWGLRRRLGAH